MLVSTRPTQYHNLKEGKRKGVGGNGGEGRHKTVTMEDETLKLSGKQNKTDE